MVQKYTGRQRVDAAFKGERTDAVPFTTMIADNTAWVEYIGLTPKECYLDPDKALQALIKSQEMFRCDMIWAPGDPLLVGTMLAWVESKYGPGVRLPPPITEKTALASMTVRDPHQHPTYATYLQMCRKVSSLFSDTWIAASVPCVWSNAAEMRGLEAFIYDTSDDPKFVHELMRFALEYGKVRGMAIAETGVNIVYADPSASCGVISPKIYREFVKPYHIELFQYLKERVRMEVKVGLHICGYIDPIMEDLVSLPVDWIEMDAPSNLERMMELSRGEKVIRGNVSAEVLSSGTKEQIETAVKSCLEIGAKGNTYILSPGCSMPQDAPLENIKIFWEAATKYGHYT